MSVISKKTATVLACATALAALTSAPSFAGVITPTDKLAVSTGSPIDSVYYGCPYRHRYHWRGCRSAWNYPVYTYANPYPYTVAGGCGAGWGGGWGGWGGGGLLGAGLFGIL